MGRLYFCKKKVDSVERTNLLQRSVEKMCNWRCSLFS